jgi:PAS domain S-box-containing protein
MRLSISTIAVLTSIVYSTQTIAFFLQYRLNRIYAGLGCWLAGTSLQAAGFLLMVLLNEPSLRLLSIFGNPLVFAGQLFMYLGIVRFLGRKTRNRSLVVSFALFCLGYFYFIFVRNAIYPRALIVSASTAIVSLLSARVLVAERKNPFAGAAGFTAAVFICFALAHAAIAALTLALPPLESYKDIHQEPLRVMVFLLPIVASMLWSFGLVIMLNQRLHAEVEEEKEKLRLIFNMSPDATSITRMGDGVFVDVNTGFQLMTGYNRGEIVGTAGPGAGLWQNPEEARLFAAELGEMGFAENMEAVFKRKDGSLFVGTVSGRVISLQDGDRVVGVIHDITERKRAEQAIRDLLAEKELILKEVHHRIKNNMSTMQSILSLQADALEDPAAAAALKDTGNRLRSMMMLYDTLYRSAKFTEMPIDEYLVPLIDEILSNFPRSGSLAVEKRITPFVLEAKKLQVLGIIVNELLTNIMKHAFVGAEGEKIEVSATLEGSRAVLAVADNGKGFPESIDPKAPAGFGLTLVEALTHQLRGDLEIERAGGTRVRLSFEK